MSDSDEYNSSDEDNISSVDDNDIDMSDADDIDNDDGDGQKVMGYGDPEDVMHNGGGGSGGGGNESDKESEDEEEQDETKEDDEDAANGYDEDDCAPPTAREDDLSEFFESTFLTTNDKEKQTKTQFTIFKDALDKTRRRRTLPILTKYEKAKIIGVRAQQIAMGSPIYLPDEDVAKFKTPMEIAQEELRQKRTPLLVRRALDSKKCVIYEDWYITDLIDPFED